LAGLQELDPAVLQRRSDLFERGDVHPRHPRARGFCSLNCAPRHSGARRPSSATLQPNIALAPRICSPVGNRRQKAVDQFARFVWLDSAISASLTFPILMSNLDITLGLICKMQIRMRIPRGRHAPQASRPLGI
jgi:hypothetical protein